MLAILRITFPFFALIAAGYVCVTLKWLAVGSVRGLNSFVLYVALPCMLFKFSAELDLETLWSQPFLPIYGVAGIALFAILLLWGRLQHIAWRDLSFVSLVGVFPNTGFIGVPLLVSMMGSRAGTPAVAIVLFDMLVTTSLSVATSTLDGHNWSSARHALSGAFKGVLSNPMLWAMLAGMCLAVMHWKPSTAWDQPIWMMADATTPVALFTTGGILARSRIEDSPEQRNQPLLPFIVAKLFAHPLMMWAGVWTALRMGWPLEPWMRQTLVLMAALPSASNVSFLAERMEGNAAWVARVTLWTTVGAFATFTLWGWWVMA
jgi:predicted permease